MRPFSRNLDVLSDRPPLRAAADERRPLASTGPTQPSSHTRNTIFTIAAGLAALLAVAILGHRRELEDVEHMSAALRTVEYARTLADVQEVCMGPEAKSGPLREHCLDQAKFLALFPECDVQCREVLGTIVPHAHR